MREMQVCLSRMKVRFNSPKGDLGRSDWIGYPIHVV